MNDSAAAWSGVSAVSLSEHLWGPSPRALRGWKSPGPSNSVHSANWWRESQSSSSAESVGKSRSACCWMNLVINWITWILKSLVYFTELQFGDFFFCLLVFQESRSLWCLICILCVTWVDFSVAALNIILLYYIIFNLWRVFVRHGNKTRVSAVNLQTR